MATTPNFTWPTPNDTDQLADGASAIRSLGDAADQSLYEATVAFSAAASDSITVDFESERFVTRDVSGTAVAIAGTAYAEGRRTELRLVGGTAVASITYPAQWTFVGTAAGTSLGTATTALITATSFGTAESDVVATWHLEV